MSEIAHRADFEGIRYAQCWEDADILLEALAIKPGAMYLSIASAGDNSLSMLSQAPQKVVAIDLSQAQLACLALRIAAYKELEHHELLELMGSRPSQRRPELYGRCRKLLSSQERAFWDAKPKDIEKGIGHSGKFEAYFQTFRRYVLPLIHSPQTVSKLLEPKSLEARREFYETQWNHWRWQGLFRMFFSRFLMGRMGRDPAFFKYVEGSVAERILSRAKYALSELEPAQNPYLQWILLGHHDHALPHALRKDTFERIRQHIDRIEYFHLSIEDYLAAYGGGLGGYNLSDIFEYMSPENTETLLYKLIAAAKPGARLAYWNMLVPRSRPESLRHKLRPLDALATQLHQQDKAFFYSRFIVEEVLP